ncbi:hypothetical protein [Candidatus Magnetaquicoccus inordinatus]|nr:hypothetical protein [Candidatus Magnetaquicoccus inordinatus]
MIDQTDQNMRLIKPIKTEKKPIKPPERVNKSTVLPSAETQAT